MLIDRDGNPRIIDFGLSKAVEEEPGLASLSSTSLREAGRGRWMAPELLMEEGVSRSCSTDVFSFACVAFFVSFLLISCRCYKTIDSRAFS